MASRFLYSSLSPTNRLRRACSSFSSLPHTDHTNYQILNFLPLFRIKLNSAPRREKRGFALLRLFLFLSSDFSKTPPLATTVDLTMSSVPGVVFATAMAAVSGTAFIVLALKIQKSLSLPPPSPEARFQPASPPRPCISSGEKKGEKKRKKVRFAKDVVEPSGNSEEFRKRLNSQIQKKNAAAAAAAAVKVVRGGMPANRAALYSGILRDRVVHRMGYSY